MLHVLPDGLGYLRSPAEDYNPTPQDTRVPREFVQYIHHHQRRMQYQEFRENGFPIGSGTVESAVKQFKARLAGPGMRWRRDAAQRMLVIRAAVLDHSFDQRWPAAASPPLS